VDEERPEQQAVADGDVKDDYRAGSIFTLLRSGEDPNPSARAVRIGEACSAARRMPVGN
jgi:hypothetical protein